MALIKVKDLVAKNANWGEYSLIDLIVDGCELTTSIGTAMREYGERNVAFFTGGRIEVMESSDEFESAGEVMDIYAANLDWRLSTIVAIHDGGEVMSMSVAEVLRELKHRKVWYFYGCDVILLPKHEEEVKE